MNLKNNAEGPPPTASEKIDCLAKNYTKRKKDLLNLDPRERAGVALKKIQSLLDECRARYWIVSRAKRTSDFLSLEINRKVHMPEYFTHEDFLQDLEAKKLIAEAAVSEIRTAFEERFEAIQATAIDLTKKPLSAAEEVKLKTEADESLATLRNMTELATIGVDSFVRENYTTLENINPVAFLQ